MSETNHRCELCGDPFPPEMARTKSGRPRQYCTKCRPGGPVGRSTSRKVDPVRLQQLWGERKPASFIAKELGCTRSRVYQVANDLSLSR